MDILTAIRTFFNPGAPAIQTRAELMGMETRASAGSTLFAPYQYGKPVWQTGNSQRYVSEGWHKSPVVFAAVLALADSVATAPLVAVQDVGDGEQVPAEDHPLQTLIDQPNPSMEQAEFLQVVSVIAALSGFCVVEKERNGAGEPVALWPLRSDWVRPIPRDQSPPAWEYRVPGRRVPFILEPEDVIVHTHAPDPNMGYTGTAPMAVAFRELGIENAMTDFLKAFFDGGAVPQYGIIPRQQINNQEMADAFLERIRGRFRQTNGGPMLLTGVEDIKRIGFNFDELTYPELRNMAEVHIATAFRVPAILIGIQAGLNASTYSNYGQARKAFYEDVIASLWRRLDGALTRGLVHEFDDTGSISLAFDTSAVAALRSDEDGLWQRATTALQAGGISTHTYQRMVGISPHGPDVLYQPFSVTPVAVDTGTTRAKPKATAHIEKMPTRALPEGRSKRAVEYDSDDHRARWEKRLSLTERWEQRFAEACASVMESQRQDVLAVIIGGGRDVREIAVDDPFDREKWIRSFSITLRPIVAGIVTEQAKISGDEVLLGLAFNVNDPHVIRAMDRQVQRFATEVNDTTWKRLRDSLTEGIANGEGIGQLAERVDAIMADRIRSSKEAIARTEVTASSSIGTLESWRQSGVVAGKEWLAALDDRTRDTHIHAHGQTVGLDENFTVGSATGAGPGMLNEAGEVVNCRCSLVPVIDVDMEDGS